jgi:protein-S-isoprenylcysteine O-methyltransferase Ste14
MKLGPLVFRWRFLLIGVAFWAGFASYRFDPVNAAVALDVALGRPAPVRALFALAALLVIAAAAVRTWAAAYLQTAVVQDSALHSDRLVADGPYRHCRNPLYLGLLLLSVGFGLAASRLGFFIIVGGNLLVVLRLIRWEEAVFQVRPGPAYRSYLQSVPRLVPSVRPRVPAGGARPRWGQAFFGESPMWFFALGAALFAATERVPLLVGCVWAAMAAYVAIFIALGIRKRGTRRWF